MARFCPKCGARMTDEAVFCGQCGAKFEAYLPQDAPDGGAVTQGMTLGDTGLLKGNLTNAPASVGVSILRWEAREGQGGPRRHLSENIARSAGR